MKPALIDTDTVSYFFNQTFFKNSTVRNRALPVKSLFFKIISEPQSQEEAEQIAAFLQELYQFPAKPSVTAYHKFENAFEIQAELPLGNISYDKLALRLLSSAQKIASPWAVHFFGSKNETELIFNRNEQTNFTHSELKAIRWAQIGILTD